MMIFLALLSPFIVMAGLYLLERRAKRIRKEQKTYAQPVNKPDFEEKITTRDGLDIIRRSSVDERLIDLDKKWNDPMA
jgi:hypothetical protein